MSHAGASEGGRASLQVLRVEEHPADVRLAREAFRHAQADADVTKNYGFQASCYLTRPVQLNAFDIVAHSTNEFWLTKARLPEARAWRR